MNPRIWFGYLFGQGKAIQAVAESRHAIWTGIGLVLLTAIARNYDQTFIGEKPFLWLFGSLLFSVVSGTWLYAIVYGEFIRRATVRAPVIKPPYWGRWRCFMGLFWMTAPVAWLYAIPVERFFDSLTAAKANLALLGIVSLWRVLLMTRVIQHLTGAKFHAVLIWTLFAAAVEVLVLFFFGGALAQSIMAGMGGMRNSPEEELMLGAASYVFMMALWGAPALLILGAWMIRRTEAEDLPAPFHSNGQFRWLAVAGLIWAAIAIYPQQQLTRNVKVERLIAAKQFREALDYLSAHEPKQFAPARVLAPNAFEHEIFTELPTCFGALRPDDANWVKSHLLHRLDQMLTHYSWRWEPKASLAEYPPEAQIKRLMWGFNRYGPDVTGLGELLDGLLSWPEGRAWLESNAFLVAGIQAAVSDEKQNPRKRQGRSYSENLGDLLSLSNRVTAILTTNQPLSLPTGP